MSGSFDFGYSFPDAAGDVASGALGILAGVLLLAVLLGLALAAVTYVLQAVSLYRIAKRRGIHHAWLAWVPLAVYWLMGSISDQYQYIVKQKVTNRRRILLALGIVTGAMSIVYSVLQSATMLAFTADVGMGNEIGSVAVSMLVYLVWLAVSITTSVFLYIAYYDLFRSCKPANAVLFLVLSIFFNVATPFFLIACSNSDEGMPPKRPPQIPVQIPYVPAAPVEEPVPVQVPAEDVPAVVEAVPDVVEEVPAAEEEIPVVEDPQ